MVIFAGDAYKTRDPNPTYQREFARRMKRIADAGIPVVMLVGNHDLPAVAQKATSISIFNTLDVPNTFIGDREKLWQITCRPASRCRSPRCPIRSRAGCWPMRPCAANRSTRPTRCCSRSWWTIFAAWRRGAATARCAGGAHRAFQRAGSQPGQRAQYHDWPRCGRAARVLADPAWDYVALGHIHKHQSLNGDAHPPVIYSGSIERIDFGEAQSPKAGSWRRSSAARPNGSSISTTIGRRGPLSRSPSTCAKWKATRRRP